MGDPGAGQFLSLGGPTAGFLGFDRFFKGFRRGLGIFFLGLAFLRSVIVEHEGDEKNAQAEVTDVGAELDLTSRQHRNNEGAEDAAAGQKEPQGQHDSSHAIIIGRGDQG